MAGAGGFVLDPPARLDLGGKQYDVAARALVMGILNRTPDSFFAHDFDLDGALRRAEQVAAEGGEVVDIGGVKAGSGPDVSVAEEIDRVCPLITAVAARIDINVSVDTFRAEVARAALAAGAVLVNDISGLADPTMPAAVAAAGGAVVVTHMQGEPRVPQVEPHYDDLVDDVLGFLRARRELAIAAGIPGERVVIDPGLDLGKTYSQSLVLVRDLSRFTELGSVILLSASHKGFLGAAAPLPVDERHEATMAAVAYGYARGARMFRVHAVRETLRVVRTMEGILGARPDDPWTSAVPDG
jgi:dihydropteroate synthase